MTYGIPIENYDGYNSIEEAHIALMEWKKRFEAQGYYSSNEGRVSLESLGGKCIMIEIDR